MRDPKDPSSLINSVDEAGIDHVLCLMQLHDIPHDKITHSIQLFGEHVIPHFTA